MLWRCARRQSDATTVRDALQLLRRLAADCCMPRGVRIRLGLLLVYLASPFDLVPDFVPIIGLADDAVIQQLSSNS